MSTQKAPESTGNPRQLNRHSMEASLAAYTKASQPGQILANETGRPLLANTHPSYSTSDVPTLKSTNGMMTNVTPPKTQAQQSFHNHNASLGRIPPNAVNGRHSRELSGGEARREEQNNGYNQISSALQASAAPFGPATTAASPVDSVPGQVMQFNNGITYPAQPYFGGYGMQMMNLGMNAAQPSNPMAFQNQMQAYQPQMGFSQYPNYGQQGRFQDSQARVIQQRRMQNGEGLSAPAPP